MMSEPRHRALTCVAIRADLGEILTGASPGRTSDDEIVIFDSTGAAFQDLAAAAMIVARARCRRRRTC